MTQIDDINKYFSSLGRNLAAVGISLVNNEDKTTNPSPAAKKNKKQSSTLKIMWDFPSCSLGLKYTFQQITGSTNGKQIEFIQKHLLNVCNTSICEVNLEGIKSRNLIELILSVKSLQYLNLSDNNLRSLPSSITQLSDLKELNLAKNNLKIVPPQIQYLLKLEELDLSWNHILTLPSSSQTSNPSG